MRTLAWWSFRWASHTLVYVTPVPDPHYIDKQSVVLDFVYNAIIADSYTVDAFESHELSACDGSRVFGEPFNGSFNLGPRARGKAPEFL